MPRRNCRLKPMPNHQNVTGQILVLGDEQKSARALKRLLEASCYTANTICSFDDADRHIAGNLTSLLIIESSASRVNGYLSPTHEDEPSTSIVKLAWAQQALTFIKNLRTTRLPAQLPILVVAKSQNPNDKVAWLNSGATAYLTKPFHKGEMISRVKTLLKS